MWREGLLEPTNYSALKRDDNLEYKMECPWRRHDKGNLVISTARKNYEREMGRGG